MELQNPLGLEINESLIESTPTTPENNTNVTKTDLNQNQIENLTIKIPFSGETSIMFCLFGFIGLIYLLFSFYLGILAIIFIIFDTLLFILITLNSILYKMEINKSNGITNVNIKNIFGCNKIKFNGNIHFFNKFPFFYIINDSNFELSTKNIKKKPARIFYPLKFAIESGTYLNIKKKFEAEGYENPLLFDIAKYMGKKRESFGKFDHKISNFMKFGEHFFTFYFSSPEDKETIDYNAIPFCLYIFYIPILSLGAFAFYVNIRESKLIALIILLIIIMIPILFCLIFNCCMKCRFHDARIDFIYSKEFDRIFIGKVNFKENSYSKTFEYKMDDIEKFFFQQPEIINGDLYLKVHLKSNRIAQIHTFKIIDEYDQEGLEYILNEKINNITSK